MQDMQLEIDILKETIDVLKKDPGISKIPLNNREKAVIVDALKRKYTLPLLLEKTYTGQKQLLLSKETVKFYCKTRERLQVHCICIL